jgi:MFS family permease
VGRRFTGILAASLPAAQFLTSYFWGKFSDRVGRKPVMLVGNVTGAVSMLALGWSPVYWAALLSRFVGGLFNGTSVCVASPPCQSNAYSDGNGVYYGVTS